MNRLFETEIYSYREPTEGVQADWEKSRYAIDLEQVTQIRDIGPVEFKNHWPEALQHEGKGCLVYFGFQDKAERVLASYDTLLPAWRAYMEGKQLALRN